LYVKIRDESKAVACKSLPHVAVNLFTNGITAFSDPFEVIPVKAKVTYEYI